MKKIEVILKVTDRCNLRCSYCYNADKGYNNNLLSLDHFEKLLTVLLTEYNLIHVIWHGGEPLTAGLDYFKKAMDVERRVNLRSGAPIENSVQTNGTLIDHAWINFFKKNHFKVGVSFDGIDNEKYRGQTEKVIKAFDEMKKKKLDFGCLAVVADDDYDLLANYAFFAERKIPFDFSKMFSEGSAKDLKGLDAEVYAKKLVDLFDRWIVDTNGVSVRTFAAYVNMALGGKFRICNFCSCHGKYISMDPDGTLYNCGRDSMRAYPFGNVEKFENASQIFSSENAVTLIKGSIERRNKCKATCEYFPLCQGGCADLAVTESKNETPPEKSCVVFKTVYSHVFKMIAEIVETKTPLDKLNPTIRNVFAKTFTRMGGELDTLVTDTYV